MNDLAVFSQSPTLIRATLQRWVLEEIVKPAIVLWGIFQIRGPRVCKVRVWQDLSTENGDQIADDVKTSRRLRVRRLVNRVILMSGYKGSPEMIVIPHGFRTFSIYPTRTEFCFDSEVAEPFVDYTFDCLGSMSEFSSGSNEYAKFTFRDVQQMNEFCNLHPHQSSAVQDVTVPS